MNTRFSMFLSAVVLLLLLGGAIAGQSKATQSEHPELEPVRETNCIVPSQSLLTLEGGMDEAGVEGMLGKRGKHQFTAQLPDGTVRCVEYRRDEISRRYWLVFTNGCLARVCHPLQRRMRQEKYGDSWSARSVFEDPELQIQQVLESPDLLGEPLQRELEAPIAKTKPSVDPGLTVVAVTTKFLSPLFRNPIAEKRRAREWNRLLTLYDPFTVSLGQTYGDVESRLGTPCFIEDMGEGKEARGYGSMKYALPGSEREFVWLVVVYVGGKSLRVFSSDFIDFDKISLIGFENERKRMKSPSP